MKDQLHRRLEELKSEYEKGQERLVDLENQSSSLKNTMMRISGAIQVLEELLQQDSPTHLENEGQSEQIKPSGSV